MPPTSRHIAEITDPLTGEQVHLEADTGPELDELIEQTLALVYPEAPPSN